MRSLNTGATGMMTQQLNVEVISNNIANMSTTGFKRQRAEFQDLLYQNLRRPGVTSTDANTIVPPGIQIGVGVRAAGVYRINEPDRNSDGKGKCVDVHVDRGGRRRIKKKKRYSTE